VLCSYALALLLGLAALAMIHSSALGAILILGGVAGAGWGLGYLLKKIDMGL
jgi:hypothetical protein